jgi:hypothetical protein
MDRITRFSTTTTGCGTNYATLEIEGNV